MNKETIEEGNKLIAEFMGEAVGKRTGFYLNHSLTKGEPVEVSDLKYHSSWEWLHGAWEKFRGLKCSLVDEGFNDHYSRHLESVSLGIVHYPIQQVFERLVKAIEWYNSQSKNQRP